MRSRVLAVALLSTLVTAAGAFAAGPLKGRTYKGSSSSSGVNSEGQTQRMYVTGPITLAVAANGRTVTVRFPSPDPILYCRTSEQLHSQTSAPARISRSGTFRATVSQRFALGPGPAPIVQVLTGRFSGRTVKGTIHTEAAECGGVASFSATAP